MPDPSRWFKMSWSMGFRKREYLSRSSLGAYTSAQTGAGSKRKPHLRRALLAVAAITSESGH